MYCHFYTVLVTLLVNAEFSYSVRYMTSLFGELNRKLTDMLPLRENQEVRVELDVSTERHHLKVFKTIRRMHLELVRSSLYLNDLYALQNLVMTTTSIIMATLFLNEIYNLEINKISEIYITSITKLFLCLPNIVIVNLSCTRTTEEAHRTGSIINKLYLSISNEKFHSKIRQFTLQLIDNRLLFKVCGLFNLGRRLFTMIVNSIITYLVILIQVTYQRSTDTVNAGPTMPPSDTPE
ncbi:uncharacterized protein LOC112493884 [Cephus cinctus]|uniref:Uncharacterized protein LOC112493884 n=1 Tax=Cephus cinctus TaxID=211228 RepID=A0AAJ7VY81_CEPCN|nr:uncharacterized protein LOC112493884 [Cephus cinctus]